MKSHVAAARARALGTLLLLLAAGCTERAASDAVPASDAEAGGVAVVCLLNRPEVLNSFVSPDRAAADLRPALFTPLVLYDSVGGFRPNLATSWAWSDDQRTLRMTLRDDIRWHDGQPVTAADVVWTLTIATDSAYGYLGRAELGRLVSVNEVDGGVEVVFAEPAAAGLEPLAWLPIMPRHLLDSIPAAAFARAEYHRQPVGSGPFRFASRLPDGSVQLDRVADYPQDLGRPLLDRIVVREVPEPSAVLVELSTGSADMCTVGSSIAKDAAAAGNRTLPIVPVGALTIALDYRKPPFSDTRVRRALSAALDRTEIAGVISPAATPARNFLPEAAVRWRDTTAAQPDNDAALAAALLDSAGWRPGSDGVRRNAAGEPLRFKIQAPASMQPLLIVVQAQWRRLGIDAQLESVEPSTFVSSLGDPERRPSALAIIIVPDLVAVPDPHSDFHSSSRYNLGSYSRPAVDSLLEQLQQVIPDERREQLYDRLQRHVADDLPLIYVVHAPRVLAVRPRLRDVVVDANGPFTHAARWWIPESERR